MSAKKRNRPRKPKVQSPKEPVHITTVDEYNQAISRLNTHLEISGRFDLLQDLGRLINYTARMVVTTKALLDMVEPKDGNNGREKGR